LRAAHAGDEEFTPLDVAVEAERWLLVAELRSPINPEAA
jgi:hypothetical protein